MIARGDLAVELSFERLAEIQEELVCFGEAYHLSVIWATQVLDLAAQTGVPIRAEVTDAAMAMRAECVMLGKPSSSGVRCCGRSRWPASRNDGVEINPRGAPGFSVTEDSKT